MLGHESKCAQPHGHNYSVEITAVAPELDGIGRVIDFGLIKEFVGNWLDFNWDHGFLIFEQDVELVELFRSHPEWKSAMLEVNPTAENLAQVLLGIARNLLQPYGVDVHRIRLHETDNCFADAVSDQ